MASTASIPNARPIRVRFGKPLLPETLEKEGLAMGSKNSYDAICVAARKALASGLMDKKVSRRVVEFAVEIRKRDSMNILMMTNTYKPLVGGLRSQ